MHRTSGGRAARTRSAASNGQSTGRMNDRPMRDTMATFTPAAVETTTWSRPGAVAGKLAGLTIGSPASIAATRSSFLYRWSPIVTASMPAARSWRRVFGYRPDPPAAFSALATTSSRPSRARRTGTACRTNWTPGVPTMSPMNNSRMLPCDLHRPRLPDDRHLDLPGVVELLLDRPGDVVAHLLGLRVRRPVGVRDHPQLPPGLDRERLVHPGEPARDRLQFFQPLDVLLQGLAARPRAA